MQAASESSSRSVQSVLKKVYGPKRLLMMMMLPACSRLIGDIHDADYPSNRLYIYMFVRGTTRVDSFKDNNDVLISIQLSSVVPNEQTGARTYKKQLKEAEAMY